MVTISTKMPTFLGGINWQKSARDTWNRDCASRAFSVYPALALLPPKFELISQLTFSLTHNTHRTGLMPKEEAASGSIDPLSGLSGLSLFPRTIMASAEAPLPSDSMDLGFIHNFMKSLVSTSFFYSTSISCILAVVSILFCVWGNRLYA